VDDAFVVAVQRRGEPLLLVFGGASVNDMLLNWATHVTKLQLSFVVACMDDALFQLSDQKQLPAVILKEIDGEQQRVQTQWKYYRMDPKAFLSMGILKVRFFVEFLRGGFDVLCSDLDVIWLADPRPWAEGVVASSELLVHADAVVSVDTTSNVSEGDQQAWGVHGEMNTGMIMLRSTAGALALCSAWMERMRQEMAKIAKISSSIVQWWTNDQTFFNEVVHRAKTKHFSPKSKNPYERLEAHRLLNGSTHQPLLLARTMKRIGAALSAAAKGPQAREAEGPQAREARAVAQIRGVVFKEMSGTRLSIATFPYLHFASGHTYFTQSLQQRLGFTPVAVHTTFQFGDTPEFTWGKRNRLRERMLWTVDKPSYYTREGPGTHAEELQFRGFVQLTGTLVEEAMSALVRFESDASIKIEGDGSYSDAMRRFRSSIRDLSEGNPNKHLLLDSFQRRLVMNLVALGRAMRRKVIMPKMTCWCDRYWWLLEDCRFPGVSRDVHPMPFHCPFDHLYDLEKWVHSPVPFREYSFLDNPRIADADRHDELHLHVRGAPQGAQLVNASRVVTLDAGANYAAAARAVRESSTPDAFVVKVDARALELLCEDIGDPAANREFNGIIHTVLGVAEQIRYCDRRANTWFDAKRGAYDQMRNPINCTWGFHRPPPLPEKPQQRCRTAAADILGERLVVPVRQWNDQGLFGMFANYHGKQVWSINERVADLYRQYI